MQTIIVEVVLWDDTEASATGLLDKLAHDVRVLTVKRVDQ